jgi:hypothetical protein
MAARQVRRFSAVVPVTRPLTIWYIEQARHDDDDRDDRDNYQNR